VAEIDTRIEVTGLAEALKTLQKVDPELRKEVVKGLKTAAAPILSTARSLIPDGRVLTNWYDWKGGWDSQTVRKGIRVAFRAGRVKGQDRDVFPLLTLRQLNAAGAIYDMAGRSFPGRGSEGALRGAMMIRKMDTYARPSRSLWPAVERNMPVVTKSLEDVIGTVSKRINQELGR
jgi:hypothetical protein